MDFRQLPLLRALQLLHPPHAHSQLLRQLLYSGILASGGDGFQVVALALLRHVNVAASGMGADQALDLVPGGIRHVRHLCADHGQDGEQVISGQIGPPSGCAVWL